MQKHYLIIVNAKGHPEQAFVRRGTSESCIMQDLVEYLEIDDPENWAFDFFQLDEYQAHVASNDPQYFYYSRFA